MEAKKYPGNVSFGPQQIIPSLKHSDKRDLDHQPLIGNPGSTRQDSVGIISQSSFGPLSNGGRRESTAFNVSGRQHSSFLGLNQPIVKCLFRTKWKVLSYGQIVFGLLSAAFSIYSHYPIFTCGVRLVTPEEDYLWFGLWIGLLNLACGLCGLAASKYGLNDGQLHRVLRRSYFILNCSFLPFANGIGLTNFGITLSKYHLICNPSPDERFTTILAFIQFCILLVCIILNILGIIYQVVATIRCKCWICSPKNQTTTSG